MTKNFSDANFSTEVLAASEAKPVLIDFFAQWCGPCRMMAPIIDEVAHAMGDKAVVGKIDTDESPATASQYNVMSIPNMLIIRHGQVVENYVGVQSKDALIDGLNKHI